ncbi:hypothetical protein RKD18_005883 [Streptomyces phaeoluteigriseus]
MSPFSMPAAAAGEAGSDFLQVSRFSLWAMTQGRDGGDGGGLLLDAEAHQHGEEQRDREDEVHEGAREHHDDAFPRLARVEHARLVAGPEFLVRRGAGVLDHAAPG